MNKKQKEKRKFSILPETTSAAIAMLAVLLIEVFFLMFILRLNILPGNYLIILFAVIIGVDAIIFKLLNCRKKKTNQRIAGIIISLKSSKSFAYKLIMLLYCVWSSF